MCFHQGSVLIVEDNAINRNLLSRTIKALGHTVTTAENGRRAVELMDIEEFDLVLLDIMMPEMNGYQVLEHMKENTILRHIPVIVISTVNDLESVVRCIELGAEDYLFKPFERIILKARVNASLEKKRLYDQEKEYVSQLQAERERSDRLLLNVLPLAIAERLKKGEVIIADRFDAVTVLSADIVDFTSEWDNKPPGELVKLLNNIFSRFDQLAENHGLEKIKTIGDAYMVVGGLPTPRTDHAAAVADMAIAMHQEVKMVNAGNGKEYKIRIGIDSGPVVAGVIGRRKFSYDLWGDTVNTASRMQKHGRADSIHVTDATHSLLKESYLFEERGHIQVKGKGSMHTYFLKGKRS